MRLRSSPRQPNFPMSWPKAAALTSGRSTGIPARPARMAVCSARLWTPMVCEAGSKLRSSRVMRSSARTWPPRTARRKAAYSSFTRLCPSASGGSSRRSVSGSGSPAYRAKSASSTDRYSVCSGVSASAGCASSGKRFALRRLQSASSHASGSGSSGRSCASAFRQSAAS